MRNGLLEAAPAWISVEYDAQAGALLNIQTRADATQNEARRHGVYRFELYIENEDGSTVPPPLQGVDFVVRLACQTEPTALFASDDEFVRFSPRAAARDLEDELATGLFDCICNEGYYGVHCAPCPVGAVCAGGSGSLLPRALPNYFILYNNETQSQDLEEFERYKTRML